MKTRTKTSAAAVVAALAIAACGQSPVASSDGSATGPATTQAVAAATDTTTSAATTGATVASSEASVANQEPHGDVSDALWDDGDAVHVTLTDGTSSADGGAVEVSGDVVTITAGGTYVLAGRLSDGQVVIDSPGDAPVKLVLDGVSISNTTGAAVAALDAGELIVILADGSANTLADGAGYVFPDTATDEPTRRSSARRTPPSPGPERST